MPVDDATVNFPEFTFKLPEKFDCPVTDKAPVDVSELTVVLPKVAVPFFVIEY